MKRVLVVIGPVVVCLAAWLHGARNAPAQAVAGGGSDESFACLAPPTLTPTLPADALLTEQPEVNCFAWQEFIALNWRASGSTAGQPDPSVGPDQFGAPGVETVVWETFKEASEVFPEGGKLPSPWGAKPSGAGPCGAQFAAQLGAGHKLLHANSKFAEALSDRQVLDELNEAGVEPPAFLTAQSGRNVYYEVRLNEDFFNYVVDPQNAFYDARNQVAAVQPGGQGINLPAGPTRYGPVGAIEIKAGWLEVEPAQRDRFLMAEAVIVEPGDPPRCRAAQVGLVGLHVIHKTPSMPNWTWATFEHVDNAPDRVQVREGRLRPGYTFFNPHCAPAEAPQCQPNRKPQPGDPLDRPIQVVREVPLPGYVERLNAAVHALVGAANPKSVFLNYELVNTLWPQSGVGFGVGARTPLSLGGAAPTTGLSNTVAETYVQTATCLDCHQFAPIACSSASGPNPNYAADYSFQLSRATEPHRPAFCGE